MEKTDAEFVLAILTGRFVGLPPVSWTAVVKSRAPFFIVGIALLLSSGQTARSSPRKTLSLADRVAYQYAIEEIYWRHRIWPKGNPGPKPSLDEITSRAQVERKVEDYLRKSHALEAYWQQPITPGQLQAEMDRMASHTKQPDVLRELFAALGNDPFRIVEPIKMGIDVHQDFQVVVMQEGGACIPNRPLEAAIGTTHYPGA